MQYVIDCYGNVILSVLISLLLLNIKFQIPNDFKQIKIRFRNTDDAIKSSKHTQLPMVPADCQIESTQQHTRTVPAPACGASTPMINNCTIVNSDSRHHQLITDQEPPDGDETDPDVIPNQYGKLIRPKVLTTTDGMMYMKIFSKNINASRTR